MASTPIARSKTAALARILDNVPRGYSRYTAGEIDAAKVEQLANKLHQKYGIGLSPAKRLTRKKNGQANALLVVYAAPDASKAQWLMLFSPGRLEGETLHDVTGRRLVWLGYELVRYADRGRTAWTWRRTKDEMRELYGLLQTLTRNNGAMHDALHRIAAQPGFHGVRKQSWELIQYAIRQGYNGETPFLYYLTKVSHGVRLALNTHAFI